MAKKKGLLLPALAAVALLAVGLALVVFLPLPEERAYNELYAINIKSIRWNGLTPREAVAELNAEIQKNSGTRYRVILAEDAQMNYPISLELNIISAAESAEYLGEESGNFRYITPQGMVIDRGGKESLYYKPSWRGDLRRWIKYKAPEYWKRLRGQPTSDPHWPSP
jgi:hypothetical protein